jgi:hypothetical protein
LAQDKFAYVLTTTKCSNNIPCIPSNSLVAHALQPMAMDVLSTSVLEQFESSKYNGAYDIEDSIMRSQLKGSCKVMPYVHGDQVCSDGTNGHLLQFTMIKHFLADIGVVEIWKRVCSIEGCVGREGTGTRNL